MKRDKILIVEDDLDLLNLIDINLTRKGYMTAGSIDGFDAMKKIDDFKPDLIVLDLMLPEIDGWVFCRWVKDNENEWVKHIPILILSAKSQPDDRAFGLFIGADDYMTKPFNVKELMIRIERLLKRNVVTQT
ncbi:MAG: hypothetical protein A3G39_09475 [Deltaproteobacteria bacterium RIFCSPLOWO2_12_FULL_43_16]|nr:MAG: hypothetical protein A3D30_02940 [Deltaproteobacteria bacterium RIFCSPHIGHO2_02_FULL_43_33]OGQ59100.1 MAG: hypothetical protein A3G39_09475 [Deltaproteobacteria bacterium RIFCSPLOWO2_12_FULL_43_16]HBR17190.1 hypothetical protein [Deltaproteobacteria bacterium]